MEIQLTKTKTITIGGGDRSSHRSITDLVGVDLFANDTRGCPAVRLTTKKGVLQLSAVGFVPPPAAALPDSWEEASKKCIWSLPAAFQAPSAALAVTSPDMFLVQTTGDAFKADLVRGKHDKDESPAAPRKVGLIRNTGAKPAATLASRLTGAPAASPAKPAEQPPPDVRPGVPLSHAGTRFVMQPMGDGDFVMEAGLPEYQVLWLSRLLPEGRSPTAASIQLKPSALAASVLRQPVFADEKGSTLALYVSDSEVHIAGYRNRDLVLWRACRSAPGWNDIREQLKAGLGIDDSMVESVLDDELIDPRPILDPLIAPILSELAVSRDYMVGKLGLEPRRALLMGLRAGAGYWNKAAEETAHLQLVAPSAFEGITPSDKIHADEGADLKGCGSHVFLGALGAALALLEEEAS